MRAMVLTGLRRMELREAPMPKLEKKTDVLLRIGAVGVCGSDVHYYMTGRIGSQVVSYPYRVGHECAATAEAVGAHTRWVSPGDRVAVDPAVFCGECDQCRAGRENTCRRLRFLGTPGQGEGCLCEYVVMPEESCFPVRPDTTLEQAALVEPLSIGLYAVKGSIPMRGARIGILGCGPIGLSVLLCARAEGAERVYVTDRIDDRLKAAHRAGAYWTGNPDHEDVRAAVGDREPLLLDAVFECCGKQEAMDQAVDLLKPGGKLVLVGIPECDRVSFSIDLLRRKEIAVQNIRRQNRCTQEALDLIESGHVDADFMVTHRFPLERTPEAFEMAARYEDGLIKAMIIL